jgi:hypothetical protein
MTGFFNGKMKKTNFGPNRGRIAGHSGKTHKQEVLGNSILKKRPFFR